MALINSQTRLPIICPKCGSGNVKPAASADGQKWYSCRGTCGKDFVIR